MSFGISAIYISSLAIEINKSLWLIPCSGKAATNLSEILEAILLISSVFNLPITLDDIDQQKILDNIIYDKKNEGNVLKFVSLKKLGKAFIDTTVTVDEMKAALDEIIFTEEDAHE